MSGTVETFQLSVDAAEAYEATFVPALFSRWAPQLVDAAGVSEGWRVLDVACGTGIVARSAAERVGEQGTVTGVDLNEAMLAVARRVRPDLEWRRADATRLPFPDDAFDAVLCQSALMFVPDPHAAVHEMARVAAPGGRVGVQVWGSLDDQPAYGPFVRVASRHAGPEAVSLLGTYWSLGDTDRMRHLFTSAGLDEVQVDTRTGSMRFPSVDDLVRVEVESTPLGDRIDDNVLARILEGTREALARFARPDGGIEIPIVGHLITASA